MTTTTKLTLSAPGERKVVSVEQAEGILKEWERQVTEAGGDVTVTTIDLSCRAWPLPTLQVFESFLKDKVVATLQVLKLDDIIASLPTDEGLDSLGFFNTIFHSVETCPHLCVVDLSDNAIGTRGIDRLKELLQRSTLHTLRFNNCGLSEQVVDQFLDVLQHPTSNAAVSLRNLSLSRNQIGAVGAEHVATLLKSDRCIELTSLEYSGSRPLKQGTRALCQALKIVAEKQQQSPSSSSTSNSNIGLSLLDLDDCVMGNGEEDDDPIHDLCQAIGNAPQLTKLVLNDGGLEEQGLSMVLQALKKSKTNKLKWLDLGAIDCGVEGAQALADYFADDDCFIKDSLQYLKVDTNALTDEGIQTLLPALSKHCTKLKTLDLTQNEIGPDGFQVILDNKLASLKKLILVDNNEEDDVPEDVLDSVKALYKCVKISEDDDDDDAGEEDDQQPTEDDGDVDALALALEGAKI